MASDRLKLPPSPIKRTPSPTNKIILPFPEEKRKHSQEILEKLRTTTRSSPTFLTTGGRSPTCIQFSSMKRPENTQTIQEKVRSTDNLSGKGLLAADLIKNLQSQQKDPASSPLLRAGSAGTQGKASNVYPTRRPHSENSDRLLVPVASNLGRRGSLPAPTLKQKSRAAKDILRKYSGGTSSDLNTSREYNEGSLPSLRKAASANRLTTIYHESAEDEESDRPDANSLLNVRKCPRRASISVPGERGPRPQTSHNNSQRLGVNDGRVVSSTRYNQGSQNTRKMTKKSELLHKQNQSNSSFKKPDETKGIGKEEESWTSGSESDNEDEVEVVRLLRKNRTSVRNRNATMIKGDRKEDGNSCSDDCSEDDVSRSSSKRRRSKKKIIERNSDDNTEEDGDSEDSSDESSEDEDHEKEDSAEEEDNDISNGAMKIKVPTDDSESEDESGGIEPNLENLLIDEELEEMSKQFAVPGMPAMDLHRTREKLAEERLITKQRGKPTEKEEVDASEDEIIDDVDDLIDDIDDLIDADDEDIAYNNKLIKKNTFMKGVKAVIVANRLAVKDK